MAQNRWGNREALIKERQELIKGLPRWKDILRGSVLTYFLPCGKKGCRCKRGKDNLHGPYYYISVKEAGKTRMYTLTHQQFKILPLPAVEILPI